MCVLRRGDPDAGFTLHYNCSGRQLHSRFEPDNAGAPFEYVYIYGPRIRGADVFHLADVPAVEMSGPLPPTNHIDGETTATVTLQVVADNIEFGVHQREIPDASPDDADAGPTDSLSDLADLEGGLER